MPPDGRHVLNNQGTDDYVLTLYVVMKSIWIKLLVISFVTIPLAVVYNDYKINIEKENRVEA